MVHAGWFGSSTPAAEDAAKGRPIPGDADGLNIESAKYMIIVHHTPTVGSSIYLMCYWRIFVSTEPTKEEKSDRETLLESADDLYTRNEVIQLYDLLKVHKVIDFKITGS